MKIKFDTIKRLGGLVRANLLKTFLCKDSIQNIAKGFSCRFLPQRDFGFALFAISINNSMRTKKTFGCFVESLSFHLSHPLSVKVLGYLPILNYKAYFILVVSTLKNTLFVATKEGLKNLSSRFLGLMRKNVEIQVQSNFNFRLFIHKNFNMSNYISLTPHQKEEG